MMRSSRRTRWHLRVLAVLTVATVGYSSVAYLDAPRLAGVGYRDVSVELADGGGLYPGSLVTLRGVEIGEVRSLSADAGSVTARIRVQDDAAIPTDSTARVRSISAAGEQYLDLSAPAPKAGAKVATLKDGDVLSATDVPLPITTATLLRRVDDLVADLPTDDLDTTLDELDTGLGAGSQDLERLLDAILPLQQQFTDNLGPTTALITRAEQVLGTQSRSRSQLTRAADGLDAFTTRLAANDDALRGSLTRGPALAEQTTALVESLRTSTPTLLRSVVQTQQVVSAYDAAIRQTLTILPGIANAFTTAVNTSPVDGAVSLFARTTVNDPPPCTNGFVQNRRSPRELEPITPPTGVYCRASETSTQAVRGARNYPCPTSAKRGATAYDCGLVYQSREEDAQVEREALATQVASAKKYLTPAAAATSTPYSPLGLGTSSGLAALLSGVPLRQGTGWQDLLTGPLARSASR